MKKSPASGFTLIEMIVVIALIVVILSLAKFKTVSNDPKVARVTTVNAIEEARARALSTGRAVRVAFCIDPSEHTLFLRSLVTLTQEGSDEENNRDWKRIGKIQTFPPFCYLWPEYSALDQKMNADFKSPTNPTVGHLEAAYIEFDPQGECAQAGSRFVFVKGIVAAGATSLTPAQPRQYEGFILRQSGQATPLINTESLPLSSSP